MGKCLAGLTRLINENKRRRVNLRREATLALEEKERIYHLLLERGRTSIAEGQERGKRKGPSVNCFGLE